MTEIVLVYVCAYCATDLRASDAAPEDRWHCPRCGRDYMRVPNLMCLDDGMLARRELRPQT